MNKKIKYLVMDVDGTLTDGKIYMGPTGEAMKAFDIKDGFGIHDILPDIGIEPVILTGRFSEIVKRRCNELGIKYVMQGVKDKLPKLKEFISGQNMTFENVAYIGDDLNDLKPMQLAGFVACPLDGCDEIKEISNYISKVRGGDGVIRDVMMHLLRSSGIWSECVSKVYSVGI